MQVILPEIRTSPDILFHLEMLIRPASVTKLTSKKPLNTIPSWQQLFVSMSDPKCCAGLASGQVWK